MKYFIAPVVRHRAQPIEIAESDYRAVAEAKDGLITVIGIEQKFDIVLENYVEYESQLLALAVRQVAFRDVGYSTFQGESLTVLRRLSNLLSSGRLYIDQIRHHLSRAFGKDHPILAQVKAKCSAEYDAKLGFRLMETLRNTMQHRSLAGLLLKHARNVDNPGGLGGVRTRIVPLLSVQELGEAGLKSAVHKELAGSRYAEVNGRVREYIQGIANVHYEFRRIAAIDRQNWVDAVRKAYARGDSAWPAGEIRASDLIAVNDSGAICESRHSFLEPINYLVGLEKKNAGPLGLVGSYVSNASEPDDA